MRKITQFVLLMSVFLIPVWSLASFEPGAQIADRDMREWSWHTTPQVLLENYYDYFQCYKETPVSVRSDGSGVYLLYRAKDVNNISSIYYTYINEAGEVEITEDLGYTGYYPDSFIDEATQDIFVSWHGIVDEAYGSFLLYDLYHLFGEAGHWKDDTVLVIDPNNAASIYPNPNDEFVWTQIVTGPSPEAGHWRVYLYAYNNAPSYGQVDILSSNLLICYADFTAEDLAEQSDLEWEYTSIPQLDGYQNEDPYWARAFVSICVIDNQVIAAGHLQTEEPFDKLICLVNDNYGEGDWTEYTMPWDYQLENKHYYIPGNPEIHLLFDENDEPLYHGLMPGSSFNVVPTDNYQKITWSGVSGLFSQYGYYYPMNHMIYPKAFSFDLVNEDFGSYDVYPQGAYPSDANPMHPFDLDEDGEVDELDENNNPLWVMDWPYLITDTDQIYQYNEQFMSSNPEEGWLAYVWVDGLNLKYADEGIGGYESWAETPEIGIVYSEDNGTTWSDPIFMNANPESENYCEQLAGMIPCYVYPGDKMTAGDNNTAILHLFFINDYAYGSYHMSGEPPNAGAEFIYASIELGLTADDTEDEIIATAIKSRNYPNPFNPQTTIEFGLAEAGDVKIEVYNVKGQKVDTVTEREYPAGTQKVIWNAQGLASGIYYYRISSNGHSDTGRMVLLK